MTEIRVYKAPPINTEVAAARFPRVAIRDPLVSGCDFNFRVVVPDATGYRFVIDGGPATNLSAAYVAALGWNVVLTWGSDI